MSHRCIKWDKILETYKCDTTTNRPIKDLFYNSLQDNLHLFPSWYKELPWSTQRVKDPVFSRMGILPLRTNVLFCRLQLIACQTEVMVTFLRHFFNIPVINAHYDNVHQKL